MVKLRDTNITMDQSYKIVSLTVGWCKKFFTPPHIKRHNPLCIMIHNTPSHNVYGQYCEKNNWLTINLSKCKNVKDIMMTTIHEYTHLCQDLKEYSVMTKEVGYNDNPFEIEARFNEDTYYTNCWRSIKNKI